MSVSTQLLRHDRKENVASAVWGKIASLLLLLSTWKRREREASGREVPCLPWDRWQVIVAVNVKQMAATCSGSMKTASPICDFRSGYTSRTLLPGYHCLGCVY